MAMLNQFRSAHRINLQILSFCPRRFAILNSRLRNKSIFLDADVLDTFTTQLVQKAADKWAGVKINESPFTSTNKLTRKQTFNANNVQYLNTKKLDSMFQDVLDEYDKDTVLLLINKCLEYKNCPSVSVVVNILCFLSQQGEVEAIKNLKTLCEDVHPYFVSTNSHFNHYLAEAIWSKGDITKAIALFKDVYETNVFLRRRIRLTLRYLIFEAVINRSEAVTVSIVKFSEHLFKHYKDSYALMCIWQVCFLSEWYTDQCLALEILERNDGFCKTVINLIPFVVSLSLKHHKTEPVYRLLEILLKHDFKLQCSVLLFALFDYRYREGDLMCCLEIYKWSMKYNVALATIQHEKFLKLLLNQDKTIATVERQSPALPCFPLKF